jgi:hypothetical protein
MDAAFGVVCPGRGGGPSLPVLSAPERGGPWDARNRTAKTRTKTRVLREITTGPRRPAQAT